ncbi:hypothetical protein [Sphaerotilus hippei]|uniref:hypothetical protein n=1 Tax=Sphaerotilus hippei TaxID=744406 RepID=UPI0011B57B02|nr:hypothetical protein [Sphaerotilus hippei]
MNAGISCSVMAALILLVSESFAGPVLSSKAHPKVFCEMAADLGYPSRGYKERTGGCASDMVDVTPAPGRSGLKNNLAFYSMGAFDEPSRLQRVSLILNVNNVNQKSMALAELVRVASSLSVKLVGIIPVGFAGVLGNAGSKTWSVGEWTVEVKSSVWPTGQGQDTTVYFRPAVE